MNFAFKLIMSRRFDTTRNYTEEEFFIYLLNEKNAEKI